MDDVLLRKSITKLFNKDELQTLCFDLGIEYEELTGDTKSSIVRDLILYCNRHGRKSKLLEAVFELRPNLRNGGIDEETEGSIPKDSVNGQASNEEIRAIKKWLLPRFVNLVSEETRHLTGIGSSTPSEFVSFSFILKGRETLYDSVGVIVRKFYGPSPTQHIRLWDIIETIPNPKSVGLKRVVFIVLTEYDYDLKLENLEHYESGIDIVLGKVISYSGGKFMPRKITSTG